MLAPNKRRKWKQNDQMSAFCPLFRQIPMAVSTKITVEAYYVDHSKGHEKAV